MSLSRRISSRPSSRRCPSVYSQQLVLEHLEDRTVPAGFSVSLSSGNLLVEEILPFNPNDSLDLSSDGTDLFIHDPNNTLSTSIPGAGDGTNTVTVPLIDITSSITVNANTDDTITVSSTLTVSVEVDFNVPTIQLNGGLLTTTGEDQRYNGSVILGADADLNGGNITFESTVDSDGTPRMLDVDANGLALFNGDIGGTDELASLNVSNLSGSTEFGTSFPTIRQELPSITMPPWIIPETIPGRSPEPVVGEPGLLAVIELR